MLAAALVCASLALPVLAADPPKGSDDPLRAVLLESKEKNRGVAIHTNGVTVNAVVTGIDDRYVVARSQQSSRIVIRLDRIDGVSAFF
jgi:hypothetical protein